MCGASLVANVVVHIAIAVARGVIACGNAVTGFTSSERLAVTGAGAARIDHIVPDRGVSRSRHSSTASETASTGSQYEVIGRRRRVTAGDIAASRPEPR